MRKFIAAIILVPLAILIVMFAVANRGSVAISLDPFSAAAHAVDSLNLDGLLALWHPPTGN